MPFDQFSDVWVMNYCNVVIALTTNRKLYELEIWCNFSGLQVDYVRRLQLKFTVFMFNVQQ